MADRISPVHATKYPTWKEWKGRSVSVVVADLLNTTILYNACWGSPQCKNEAMGAKIHQKHFSGKYGLSLTSTKFLVLNMNENSSAMHPSNALHFLHRVPYGSESISMRFGGVKIRFGVQEKQSSIKARVLLMVRERQL